MLKLNVQTLKMTISLRLKTVNMYNEYLSLNIELHLRDVHVCYIMYFKKIGLRVTKLCVITEALS